MHENQISHLDISLGEIQILTFKIESLKMQNLLFLKLKLKLNIMISFMRLKRKRLLYHLSY